LAWLPENERNYWEKRLAETAADEQSITFLALTLDEEGQPIPIANTDVATWLFLENLTEEIVQGASQSEEILKQLQICVVPYPVGLFMQGVGQVATNDAYASSEVWEMYERDPYHSPRTIWGREINLLLLGLNRQIQAAYDAEGKLRDANLDSYVRELNTILNKTLTAIEASGLKYNELWSYRIEDGQLRPARYATTTDIQLWNLTNLAVEFLLEKEKER